MKSDTAGTKVMINTYVMITGMNGIKGLIIWVAGILVSHLD